MTKKERLRADGTDFIVAPDPSSGGVCLMAWNPEGLSDRVLGLREPYFYYNDVFCRLDIRQARESLPLEGWRLPDDAFDYFSVSFDGGEERCWERWLSRHVARVPARLPEVWQMLLAARLCGFSMDELRERLSRERIAEFEERLPYFGMEPTAEPYVMKLLEESITALPGFRDGYTWLRLLRKPAADPLPFTVTGEMTGGWTISRQDDGNVFFLRQAASGNCWEEPLFSRWHAVVMLDAFLERLRDCPVDWPEDFWTPEEISENFNLMFKE